MLSPVKTFRPATAEIPPARPSHPDKFTGRAVNGEARLPLEDYRPSAKFQAVSQETATGFSLNSLRSR
jgi:hypothetical protein